MKKKTGGILKLIPGAIFMIAVFVMFALNIAEAVGNYKGNEDSSGLRSVVRDLESVDKVTYPFVNVNGLYQNVMQRNYMYDADSANDTIKTTRGQLASVSSSVSKKKMKAAVQEYEKALLKEGDSVITEKIHYSLQPQLSYTLIDQKTGQVKVLV